MTNLREAAQMALDAYESRMQQIGGCSDGGCVVVKPKGMHTNGGCRCWKNERSMQRLAMAANSLTKALRAALAQPEQEKLGEIVPADEEQLERIAKLVKPEPQGGYRWREGDVPPSMTYTAPPQREWCQCKDAPNDCTYEKNCRVPQIDAAFKRIEWQGLTDDEIISATGVWDTVEDVARAIEAKLKEKNA